MKALTVLSKFMCALLAGVSVLPQLAAQSATATAKKAQHHHYKLIDVGTLGGPGSGVFDSQRELTPNGAVVGVADTPIPDPYAPSCFDLQDCLVEHGFLWQYGVMTDLGALPGVNNSQAEAVNEHGMIVGQSQNGVIDPYLGIPATEGVAWADGRILDLGTMGGYQSLPLDVNDAGQVTGASTNSIPDQYSFVGGTQVRAFLYEKGSITDLGTLGGPDAFGQFINELGQVAGFSYTSSTPGPGGVPPCDPFIWDRQTGMKDLGNFGSSTCDLSFVAGPFHLNNRGELVGGLNTAGDVTFHPFLWDGKQLIDLGTLSGDLGRANWVNEAGDAVGFSAYADGRLRGVLWRNHKKIKDLGTLAGHNCSDAQTINDRGQIVGTSFAYTFMGPNDGCHYSSTQITSQHAVLWEDGTIIDLNTVIQPNASLTLVEAKYINDRGEIAGMGIPPGVPISDFEFHGHVFLLVPCDDDHPGIEGCDYSTVDADTAATAVTQAPATKVPSPFIQGNPAFGGAMNPMLRRFGDRFGPWLRGLAPVKNERPASSGRAESSDASSSTSNDSAGSSCNSATDLLAEDRLDGFNASSDASAGAHISHGLMYGCSTEVSRCQIIGPVCYRAHLGERCWDIKYQRWCFKCLPYY